MNKTMTTLAVLAATLIGMTTVRYDGQEREAVSLPDMAVPDVCDSLGVSAGAVQQANRAIERDGANVVRSIQQRTMSPQIQRGQDLGRGGITR